MAEIIRMPKQGLQMTEGTIMAWLIPEGGEVKSGTPFFEMETDKLTITIDAEVNGVLRKIVRGQGEVVPITEVIAIVGAADEDISVLLAAAGAAPVAPAAASTGPELTPAALPAVAAVRPNAKASPRAKRLAAERGISWQTLSGSGPNGLIIEQDLARAAAPPAATPLARKLAGMDGLALTGITGSGAHGKIVADDVRAAQSQGTAAEAETLVPMTGMRRVIAARMKESLLDMAQANHRATVDMSESARLRDGLKAAGVKASYNDIVLRCVARALTEFPDMNASWSEAGIVRKRGVNIGVAVAVDEGLLVPVIHGAEKLTLPELAERAATLAGQAKSNRLSRDDCSGGTFTVSNLGMLGLDSFTAIINSPEAGILAVGKIARQPVVGDGDAIVIKPMMQLSLTYDHRIVDGAPAARFLMRIKILLEAPWLLL